MLMVYSWFVTIRDLMCIVAVIMWDSPNAINNYHLGMVYEFLMIFLGWFLALALSDCCYLLPIPEFMAMFTAMEAMAGESR